jgi:hypothetical protein
MAVSHPNRHTDTRPNVGSSATVSVEMELQHLRRMGVRESVLDPRSGANLSDGDYMSSHSTYIQLSHHLPIMTRCPLSRLPDFIYVTLHINDEFVELYEARKRIRKLISGKRMFMEDIATMVLDGFPEVEMVQVRLMGGAHVVSATRENVDD